ncbi:expressed unknown protein [Seminavis robusta]|uniref:Uncharacterized protein n=1 Tax=Seminavis robusta TaxID=568900 RepID=A0A9N8DZQ9_9STRA|nr:expressed unknown protein [Seminavis robusta]|eukprot:Sro406_g136490.1 n/a (336) ;mRNA; f:60206-61321
MGRIVDINQRWKPILATCGFVVVAALGFLLQFGVHTQPLQYGDLQISISTVFYLFLTPMYGFARDSSCYREPHRVLFRCLCCILLAWYVNALWTFPDGPFTLNASLKHSIAGVLLLLSHSMLACWFLLVAQGWGTHAFPEGSRAQPLFILAACHGTVGSIVYLLLSFQETLVEKDYTSTTWSSWQLKLVRTMDLGIFILGALYCFLFLVYILWCNKSLMGTIQRLSEADDHYNQRRYRIARAAFCVYVVELLSFSVGLIPAWQILKLLNHVFGLVFVGILAWVWWPHPPETSAYGSISSSEPDDGIELGGGGKCAGKAIDTADGNNKTDTVLFSC